MNGISGMDFKFIVLKKDDVEKYLMASELSVFKHFLSLIASGRKEEGKAENLYMVINTDESYAPEIAAIMEENGHWGLNSIELPKTKTISDLVNDAHQNAIDKGWYEEEKAFGEIIALIHSELSEALEDYRNGRKITEVYHEGEKPCGIPSELADVVIRIFDTCGFYGIDLEAAIHEKMAYNATRPKRHGGKRL